MRTCNNTLKLGDPCTTPTQIPGTCVPLTQCPYVAGLLAQEPRTRDVTNYVIGTQSSCGGRSVNRSPIVNILIQIPLCSRILTQISHPRCAASQHHQKHRSPSNRRRHRSRSTPTSSAATTVTRASARMVATASARTSAAVRPSRPSCRNTSAMRTSRCTCRIRTGSVRIGRNL